MQQQISTQFRQLSSSRVILCAMIALKLQILWSGQRLFAQGNAFQDSAIVSAGWACTDRAIVTDHDRSYVELVRCFLQVPQDCMRPRLVDVSDDPQSRLMWQSLFTNRGIAWLHDQSIVASAAEAADTFSDLEGDSAAPVDLLGGSLTDVPFPSTDEVFSHPESPMVETLSASVFDDGIVLKADLPALQNWIESYDETPRFQDFAVNPASPRRRRRGSAYVQVGRILRTEIREPGRNDGAFGPRYRSRTLQPRPNGPTWEVATGITWREFLQGDSYARRFRDTTLGLRWDINRAAQFHLVWTRSLFDVTEDGDPVNRGLGLRTQFEF